MKLPPHPEWTTCQSVHLSCVLLTCYWCCMLCNIVWCVSASSVAAIRQVATPGGYDALQQILLSSFTVALHQRLWLTFNYFGSWGKNVAMNVSINQANAASQHVSSWYSKLLIYANVVFCALLHTKCVMHIHFQINKSDRYVISFSQKAQKQLGTVVFS